MLTRTSRCNSCNPAHSDLCLIQVQHTHPGQLQILLRACKRPLQLCQALAAVGADLLHDLPVLVSLLLPASLCIQHLLLQLCDPGAQCCPAGQVMHT